MEDCDRVQIQLINKWKAIEVDNGSLNLSQYVLFASSAIKIFQY